MSGVRSTNFLKQLDLRRKTLRDEIEDDIAPLRGMSIEDRGKLVESVCRDAMAILRGREDFAQAIGHQDPRSEESMQTWLRLVRKYRTDGRD